MTTPIACNLLWLRPGVVGGTESYAVRLLASLAEHAPATAVDVYAMGRAAEVHTAVLSSHGLHTSPRADAPAPLRVGLERTWLARTLRDNPHRLVHHLGGTVPSVDGGPTAVTIHDLQPLHDPSNFSGLKRRWLARAIPAAIQAADLICTPSDWVAETIQERFDVGRASVRTVSAHARPTSTAQPRPTASVEHLLSAGPVLLYPAMTMAHKNHRMLFRAFSVAAERRADLQLVCVGAVGRDHEELVVAAAALSDRIHLLGHVPAEDLSALMAGAEALVFPSRYEGFGLPVLEAQQVGLPVVASNATALPEVAGRGALLLDPDDVDPWIDVMSAPLPADTRIDLIRAGAANAERYTPESMAAAQVAAWETIT